MSDMEEELQYLAKQTCGSLTTQFERTKKEWDLRFATACSAGTYKSKKTVKNPNSTSFCTLGSEEERQEAQVLDAADTMESLDTTCATRNHHHSWKKVEQDSTLVTAASTSTSTSVSTTSAIATVSSASRKELEYYDSEIDNNEEEDENDDDVDDVDDDDAINAQTQQHAKQQENFQRELVRTRRQWKRTQQQLNRSHKEYSQLREKANRNKTKLREYYSEWRKQRTLLINKDKELERLRIIVKKRAEQLAKATIQLTTLRLAQSVHPHTLAALQLQLHEKTQEHEAVDPTLQKTQAQLTDAQLELAKTSLQLEKQRNQFSDQALQLQLQVLGGKGERRKGRSGSFDEKINENKSCFPLTAVPATTTKDNHACTGIPLPPAATSTIQPNVEVTSWDMLSPSINNTNEIDANVDTEAMRLYMADLHHTPTPKTKDIAGVQTAPASTTIKSSDDDDKDGPISTMMHVIQTSPENTREMKDAKHQSSVLLSSYSIESDSSTKTDTAGGSGSTAITSMNMLTNSLASTGNGNCIANIITTAQASNVTDDDCQTGMTATSASTENEDDASELEYNSNLLKRKLVLERNETLTPMKAFYIPVFVLTIASLRFTNVAQSAIVVCGLVCFAIFLFYLFHKKHTLPSATIERKDRLSVNRRLFFLLSSGNET